MSHSFKTKPILHSYSKECSIMFNYWFYKVFYRTTYRIIAQYDQTYKEKKIMKAATQKYATSDKRNSLCHLETSERDLPYFKSCFRGSTKLMRNPCLILFISKLTSRHSPYSKR